MFQDPLWIAKSMNVRLIVSRPYLWNQLTMDHVALYVFTKKKKKKNLRISRIAQLKLMLVPGQWYLYVYLYTCINYMCL